jgi:eukaryotic-like serine/threonine-protein kinase
MGMPGDQFERLRAALAPRYRILSELGHGGMATVYLAEDLKHDRRVAVKVLRPELAATLGPERFLREIQIAAVLAHPHILPLHDSGEAGGFLYYVMPYLEGETLRDRLVRQRQLPVAEAVRVAREVSDGLDYAHGRGIVHRDIKPENILFMGGHAVIADFGVASAVGLAGGTRLTQSGWSLGTPMYMSPEQALGQDDVDGRSDVYALGCVLYEMLAGEPPFHASSPQAVLAKKLSESPPRLTHLRETVSPELEEAVRRALAKVPADRFDTAAEFAQAATRVGSQDAPASSAPRSARKRVGWSAALVVGVFVVALIGVAIWRLRVTDGSNPAQRLVRPTTVAVLPFENLGPAENEYFPAGITDEITTRLGSASGISVVPRRAAQRYTRSDMTMREIGRKLGVDYLLVGSVRWDEKASGSRNVRIALELLQARDERQLWATTYDRVIDDIFEVQSDIAGQVVERLGVALPEDERSRLRARPTGNHEAYILYLKGRYFWNKRTEGNIQIALDYFQRAVDLDPSYSLAWVGIADTWIFRGWYSLLAPREAFPKAEAAVLKALEFDSTLAEAHASMAHIHLEFDHDWAAAEREYRRAIQLNSRYPTAHHWYGGFLSAMGRHEEALQQAETARRLDPLSLIIQTWIGLRYYFARKYEDAIPEYLKALELDRDFAPAHWHLGWVYEQTGDFQKGVSEAERAVAIDGNNLLYVASLGHAYARARKAKEARATLARLAQASAARHVSAYHVALIHIALGDVETGLDWLERAYDEQSPWIGYMKVDPRLDPVRSQPRFERLLKKARLDF